MKKIHIAIGVKDVERSVEDYSLRLGKRPTVVIPNEYALWRTPQVNFSIRCDRKAAGTLRHLGWEDSTAAGFTKDTDLNGIVWERFTAAQQADEINKIWPPSKKGKPSR